MALRWTQLRDHVTSRENGTSHADSALELITPKMNEPSAALSPTDASPDREENSVEPVRSEPIPILLIEDNATDIFVITEVVKGLGLDSHLRIASDGDSALKFWDGMTADSRIPCPGLVLLDLNLPSVSGLYVLMRIRNGSGCANVPVIVVTSSDSPDDVKAAGALKASAYFRKPVELAAYIELGQVIRGLLPGWNPGPVSL